MSCFVGLFRKRSKQVVKTSDDSKQTEQVEIPGEEAVDSRDAANGYRRATALQLPRHGGGNSEAAVLGFSFEDLLRASAEILGQGTFGTTYKADLEIGTSMVVKRLWNFNASEMEFRKMVDAIDKMNHENVFTLTAYFYSNDDKLLVYDYTPIGSLHTLLHVNGSGRSPLNWDTKISIALGAARAIEYIHSQSPTTCHGNIKSSNVLLTRAFEARVSDYGLAEYGPPHIEGFTPAANLDDGYCAPEVTYTSKVSQKADVYSFGVLFWELLTGKDPTESYLKDEGMDLPRWMVSAVNDEWTSEVFDVELLRNVDEKVLLKSLELAFIWTARDPDVRLSMPHVITQIEKLCGSYSHAHVTCIEY